MLALKRRLYRLILRLHPAAFRDRFAREMALDFEDALAAYGFSRLLLDAARSLARQWATQLIQPSAPLDSISRPSLLTGNYSEIQDEPMRPFELARGLVASALLLALCLFAFSAGPGRIPRLGIVYAAPPKRSPSSSAANADSAAQAASSSPATSVGVGDKPLTFDVVSIREDKSISLSTALQWDPTPDGYHLKGVPIFGVIQNAFVPSQGVSFRPGDVIGAPDWLFSVRYDINAKISAADLPRWNDPAQQPATRQAMLQAMLADRFRLVAHRETRIMPIFELTVGSHSPKFKPAQATTLDEIRQKYPGAQQMTGGFILASGPNPGEQRFFGVTMPAFCDLLRNLAGRPVHDNTGLTGKYDISYQLELLPPDHNGAVPPDYYSLQFHTIIEDQLGLKLTSTKGPVEVLVIDHIEKPSEN